MQLIVRGIARLDEILHFCSARRAFLVCDPAFDHLTIRDSILDVKVPLIRFDRFTPNPKYEEAAAGTELFRESGCDAIVAVGGGSAMDVAKCIRAFSGMDSARGYLKQPFPMRGTPLIAVPTTAGTGSESTRYVALYQGGEKQSLANDILLPDWAILEPEALTTLPALQRKCTMLDALCHAVESWWSVRSTEASRVLSRRALTAIVENMAGYLQNLPDGNLSMQIAANLAGQAIDLSPTTAAHAMSYRLTMLYGLPHGQAAGMCLPYLWGYMLDHMDLCRDPRGEAALHDTFLEIAKALGAPDERAGVRRLREMLAILDLPAPRVTEEEIRDLARSVNPVRLSNNPIPVDTRAAEAIYHRVLCA